MAGRSCGRRLRRNMNSSRRTVHRSGRDGSFSVVWFLPQFFKEMNRSDLHGVNKHFKQTRNNNNDDRSPRLFVESGGNPV